MSYVPFCLLVNDISIITDIDFSKVVPTKVSVVKIQRFLEYSVEDRSFFTHQSFDVREGEEDQNPDVVLVEERRVEEGEVEREEEEQEKGEEEMEGNFSFPFIIP